MRSARSDERPRTRLPIAAALAAAFVAGLVGCSSSVPIRSPGVKVGASGTRAELVFSAADVVEATPEWATDLDVARLDHRLHQRDDDRTFADSGAASACWPSPSVPSLSRGRHIRTWTSSPDQVLYFEPRRTRRDRW